MDRLKALSIFKAVVDNGSFVGAANSLEISCPVVTRTVQDLEGLLGVRLLHRTTRRIGLTAVGQDVLDRVAELLQSYDELESIGRLSDSETSGVVRLSAGRQDAHVLALMGLPCAAVAVGRDIVRPIRLAKVRYGSVAPVRRRRKQSLTMRSQSVS